MTLAGKPRSRPKSCPPPSLAAENCAFTGLSRRRQRRRADRGLVDHVGAGAAWTDDQHVIGANLAPKPSSRPLMDWKPCQPRGSGDTLALAALWRWRHRDNPVKAQFSAATEDRGRLREGTAAGRPGSFH